MENEGKNVDMDALILEALTRITEELGALTKNQTEMSKVMVQIHKKVVLSD